MRENERVFFALLSSNSSLSLCIHMRALSTAWQRIYYENVNERFPIGKVTIHNQNQSMNTFSFPVAFKLMAEIQLVIETYSKFDIKEKFVNKNVI